MLAPKSLMFAIRRQQNAAIAGKLPPEPPYSLALPIKRKSNIYV